MRDLTARLDEFIRIARAHRLYRGSMREAFRRFQRLYHTAQFSRSEILRLGLLDPAVDEETLARYVSKERIWPLYARANPYPQRTATDDKYRFHTRCMAACIPVPELLGVFEPRTGGAPATAPPTLLALLDGLPEKYVAKPSHGLTGEGVLRVVRQAENKFQINGQPSIDLQGLLRRLDQATHAARIQREYSESDHRLLFQRTLNPHPDMQGLCGAPLIQCIRICTVIDPAGKPHPLFAFLKVIVAPNVLDNLDSGRRGNLIAQIDMHSGRLQRVTGIRPGKPAATALRHHPDTGIEFRDFTLPHWQDALGVALQAASEFSETGLIGWDVTVTENGAVLLEGNSTWHPNVPLHLPFDVVAGWVAQHSADPGNALPPYPDGGGAHQSA